ncbi:MAG: hypothetical protein ACPGTU_17640 [Myxococcota bacterium]
MSVVRQLCIGALIMGPARLSFAETLWDQGPISNEDLAALDAITTIGKSLSTGITADEPTTLWVTTMYRDLGELNLERTHQSLHSSPSGSKGIGARGILKTDGLYLSESIRLRTPPDGREGLTTVELSMDRQGPSPYASTLYDIKQHIRLGTANVSGKKVGTGVATLLEWLEQVDGIASIGASLPATIDVVEQGADIALQQTKTSCGNRTCVLQEWEVTLNHDELLAQGRADLAEAVQDMAGMFRVSGTIVGDQDAKLGEFSILSDPLRLNVTWASADGVILGERSGSQEWFEWNPMEKRQELALHLKFQATYQGFQVKTEDLQARLSTVCNKVQCEASGTISTPPSITLTGLDPVRSALVNLADDLFSLSEHANEFGQVLAHGKHGEGSSLSLGLYRARNVGWVAQEQLACTLPDNEVIRFAFALVGGILPTPNVIIEAAGYGGDIIDALVTDYRSHRTQLVDAVN